MQRLNLHEFLQLVAGDAVRLRREVSQDNTSLVALLQRAGTVARCVGTEQLVPLRSRVSEVCPWFKARLLLIFNHDPVI